MQARRARTTRRREESVVAGLADRYESADRPRLGARERLLRRLGLRPSAPEVVASFLDAALPEAAAVALDAGCGRLSALAPLRARIGELVGLDIQTPASPLPWLDRFVVADLCDACDEVESLPPETFDLVLTSFTIEHLADPDAAFRAMATWLKPGGWLVASTVNRRNPLVNAYISLPRRAAAPLQRLVKAEAADAYPLVGACNSPARLRAALRRAGFDEVEVVTTDHLARAWGRRLPAFAIGLVGDLVFHPFPSRRSTIVARARRSRSPSPR